MSSQLTLPPHLACGRALEDHPVCRRVDRDEAAVLFRDPNLAVLEAADHVFEIGLRRKLDGKPAAARRASRRGARALTCPPVQTEVVVVTARRDEPHARDTAHHVEADEV